MTSMADRTDFGTFGRYRETPVADMPADMKDAYDFTKSLRGLVPGNGQNVAAGRPSHGKSALPRRRPLGRSSAAGTPGRRGPCRAASCAGRRTAGAGPGGR